MMKYQTRAFDWIENVPPSSPELREKLNSILQTSESIAARISRLDENTGQFQITVQGTLKKKEPMRH